MPVKQIAHLNYAIPASAHTPMYLMHKWWARKPHNVVAEYIERYSKKGNIVLDPFSGSGVTVIESIRHGRKAVSVDLDPIASFITEMTLKKVNLKKYEAAFEQIRIETKDRIDELYLTECPKHKNLVPLVYAIISDIAQCSNCKNKTVLITAKKKDKDYLCDNCGERLSQNALVGEVPVEVGYECQICMTLQETRVRFLIKKKPEELRYDVELVEKIDKMPIPYWYPNDYRLYYKDGKPFMKKERSEKTSDLFTKRSLIALSILYDAILKIEDSPVRDLMKLTFSSNLHNVSRLNPIHTPRHLKGEHPSTSWIVHSYWIPLFRVELPLWFYFEERYKHILAGKHETDKELTFHEAKKFDDLNHGDNGLILTQSAIKLEEIPSNSIDYCFTDPPYGESIQYLELSAMWCSWLAGSENDKRFRLNFADEIIINDEQGKDFDYYHRLLRAAFSEVYRVLKPEHWLTVTFHNNDIKIYNSILKAVVLSGFDLEKVIYQPPARASAKGLFQPYGSAIGDYYIRFKKPKKERGGLLEPEIDKERYERIVIDSVTKIIAHRGEPTPYSIIINSYPLIYDELKKNGYLFSTPENIEDILKRNLKKQFILVPVKDLEGHIVGKKWWFKDENSVPFLEKVPLNERVERSVVNVLNRKVQVSFDDIQREVYLTFPNSLIPDTESIRSILAQYAEKTPNGNWRLSPQVKIREGQHNRIVEELAGIGLKAGYEVYADVSKYRHSLPFSMPAKNLDRVKEIDVIWYTGNKIKYEFEVENTTGISEAVIRGSNIEYQVNRYIVIPDEREPLLSRKVQEPATKERIEKDGWKFMRYDDLTSFCDKYEHRKSIPLKEFESIGHEIKGNIGEYTSLEDFTEKDTKDEDLS